MGLHQRLEDAAGPWKLPLPATALRGALSKGYRRADFLADLMAGLTVGIVALPLSMALAIATGVPPQHGLYTAIVGGAVIALLGGSRVQVSGPTAAFVVVLAPITAKFGLGGLLLATAMAGVFLVVMGLAQLGKLIQFIPNPVTTGFTGGIAVVIATLQLKDFFGLTVDKMPAEYLERVEALARALPTLRWQEFLIGAVTLAILIGWPRLTRKVPAPLVALTVAALLAAGLRLLVPGFTVATIASRFTYMVGGTTFPGIPQLPPLPALPWHLPGADGTPLVLSLELLRALAPAAFAIAMLGAIESLLSAVVADAMTRGQHDPDAELLAQGTGNILAPFFGGIAATGAIARTATNIRAGARTPISSVIHSLFLLLAMLLLAPILGFLPMSALAAQLLVVAWNMSERKHFAHIVRVAPKSDVFVLLSCFFLTVVFDMVVAVVAGVMLASLLFMKRMSEVSGITLVSESHPLLDRPLPRGVLLYDVAGPLFFGAAERAMSRLKEVESGVKVVVLDISGVPAIDATGLVSLESTLERLIESRVYVVLAGVQEQPYRVLAKAGLRSRKGRVAISRSFQRGINMARLHVERDPLRSQTIRIQPLPPA
jgi:SulP family sulfate permease